MNLKTGLVSQQFNLVFDDNFETVPHLRVGTVPDNWTELVTNSREKSTEDFYDITKTWFDGEVDITADSPDTSIPSAAMQQTSSSMQQPAATMHQPAAKQQPLSATQQPALHSSHQLLCSNWPLNSSHWLPYSNRLLHSSHKLSCNNQLPCSQFLWLSLLF